jgi:hypothetical protein
MWIFSQAADTAPPKKKKFNTPVNVQQVAGHDLGMTRRVLGLAGWGSPWDLGTRRDHDYRRRRRTRTRTPGSRVPKGSSCERVRAGPRCHEMRGLSLGAHASPGAGICAVSSRPQGCAGCQGMLLRCWLSGGCRGWRRRWLPR